jgi:hypothetical protein
MFSSLHDFSPSRPSFTLDRCIAITAAAAQVLQRAIACAYLVTILVLGAGHGCNQPWEVPCANILRLMFCCREHCYRHLLSALIALLITVRYFGGRRCTIASCS